MNKLVIPPPPAWYEPNILACAPDNTVIYASRGDVIIIHPKPLEEPADIKILSRCHRERIIGVVINPNWGNPDKLAVTIGEEKTVSLSDITTCKVKVAHSGHTTRSDKLVGVTFAGHDRVISVSEDGFIIIWKWASNQLNSLSDLLGSKVKVSCISSCPHASWLTAFGLKKGEIVITDLRRFGRVLYRLRGHDSSVLSLSWCPTPYNIFPKSLTKNAKLINMSKNTNSLESSENTPHKLQNEIEDLSFKPEENIQVVVVSAKIENEAEDVNPADAVKIPSPILNNETEENIKIESPTLEQGTENTNPANTDENSAGVTETISIKLEKEMEAISTGGVAEVEDINSANGVTNTPTKLEEDSSSKLEKYIEGIVTENASLELKKDSNTADEVEKTEYINGLVKITSVSDIKGTENIVDLVEITSGSKIITENFDVNNQDSVLNELEIIREASPEITKDLHEGFKGKISIKNESEDQECEIENGSPKEYLLASSARGGRSIIIWRAGTDGIKQTELSLPGGGKPRGNQRTHQAEEKTWITLCWVTPKSLLSSSPKGELLQWNLLAASNTKGGQRFRVIHSDHNKHVFGIAAPIRLHQSPDDEDWRDKNLLNAWTVGKDRLILNTSLCAQRKTLALYPTIAGSICCMVPSILYPNKIAMGAGEGSIRLWDFSRPHLQYITMTKFSDKSQHRILCLAWHPTKETILAFGTADGRVGLMDPCNRSKSATYLVQYVNGPVHKLDWGPVNGELEHFALFAVAGGKLISYDINKRLDAPIVFDITESITQMSWKSDHSICALATKPGHVSLFSSELKPLTTFYLQNKSVRSIVWHPEVTRDDVDVSPYANWLAVATNDVTVYDCSLTDGGSGHDYSERIVAVFNEHTKFVTCLSWSSFEGAKLASASEDGTALVWDVKTKTLLHSCITSNDDVLTSVLWSPSNHGYIITGSKNNTLQIWKLSENPPQQKVVKKQHPKVLKLKEAETSDTEKAEEEIEEIEKPKKVNRKFVLSGLVDIHNRNAPSVLLEDCERLFAKFHEKTEDVDKPPNGETVDDKRLDILKVFGNEADLNNVLDLEKYSHSKRKQKHSFGHISLWRGEPGVAIREAITTKTLSPWHISMAPMVSHKLYLEACEAYADHLSEERDCNPYEIASYYLACHNVEKAVDILFNTNNFLEALVLAKCRSVPSDPLITKVIEKWARSCVITGGYEVAAQCYIVLNRLEDAAKALFRRTDKKTLEFCAELAKRCDNKNLLDAVLFRLNSFTSSQEEEEEINELPLLTRAEVELSKLNNKRDQDCGDTLDSYCRSVDVHNEPVIIKENGDGDGVTSGYTNEQNTNGVQHINGSDSVH